MELNIDIILADLKEGKVKRTQQNLEKLNDTLKKYAESGQRDFSITKLGWCPLPMAVLLMKPCGLPVRALPHTDKGLGSTCNTSIQNIIGTSRSKSVPADYKL
jgi:hypothetical protein